MLREAGGIAGANESIWVGPLDVELCGRRAGRGGGAEGGEGSTIPPSPKPPNRGAPCRILLTVGAGLPCRKTVEGGGEAGVGEVGREGGLEGM